MDNHKKKHARIGNSMLRRDVRPNLFTFMTGLCPIDDEEKLYEKLKSVAQDKNAIEGTSHRSTPSHRPTPAATKVIMCGSTKYPYSPMDIS